MSVLGGGTIGAGPAGPRTTVDQLGPLPCAPMTIEERIKDLESRMHLAEEKLSIAETVYTRLIGEVNALRNQLGIPDLDRNYFLP
ncbi:MAG: hypothetical protein ACWGQW_02665 [bacterium]